MKKLHQEKGQNIDIIAPYDCNLRDIETRDTIDS